MTESDRRRFATGMFSLCSVFDKEMTDFLTNLYFNALKAWEIPAVEFAIAEAIKKGKFFPRPEVLDALATQAPRTKSLADEQKAIAERSSGDAPNGIAELCGRVVKAVLSGKLTREKFIEAYDHLHHKFPTAGFDREKVEMMRYYRVCCYQEER